MKLTVIGAGPAYTDRPGAVGSSYLVSDGPTNLLLDLGHGAFSNLAGRIEPSTLSGVAVTHLHPDHFIDLVPLRHYLRYEFEPPRRLPLLAPAALAARLDALLGQPGFTADAFDVDVLGERKVRQFWAFLLEARHVTHTDDSYAFRVSPAESAGYQVLSQDIQVGSGGLVGLGRTGHGPIGRGAATGLVYSGDCGRAADLKPLIRPGDILLSEVSFGVGPVAEGAQHMDATDVGTLAREAGVSRILLTHLLSGRDRAATVAEVARVSGGIPTHLVDPGEAFDL